MVRDERQAFGELLRSYRLAARLTHEGLAGRAGLSPRTISDLERGVSRYPRPDSAVLLRDALNLSPEQRQRFEAAARPRMALSIASSDAAGGLGSLPVQLTSFIGRKREVQAVRDLLGRADTRLVTLTGPGGTGKTRLAVQVAEELRGTFQDGACFVALAPVVNPDGVMQAIARAVDASEHGTQPAVERLIATLGNSELLLLLDNFEHVLDAAPVIAELLRGCPWLTVLVTSRAALRLSGEQEYPVAPLPVPDVAHLPPLNNLALYAAVELFVERALRVKPDFRLTDETAAIVAMICARLDGLPLAIELAAARMKILPPRDLLARLTDGTTGTALHLLTGGVRDLPERQRTLRDTMLWSYLLLDPPEQSLFGQFAVFAGGCTLEAAEAICILPPVSTDTGATVLDVLASLLDKSLIYQAEGPDGAPRFLMLETIREFALERLAAADDEVNARARHAAYYLAMVEANGALLFASRSDQLRAVVEQGNMLAALHWWMQHG